jgi:hypothetical protein
VADPSRLTFLLQLDLKEKMTLIQGKEKYTIYDDLSYGPVFGGGYDICIADNCNSNMDSHAYFPVSYNCGFKYQNNQESWTAFCGATKGKNFRVIEYEVFQVIK